MKPSRSKPSQSFSNKSAQQNPKQPPTKPKPGVRQSASAATTRHKLLFSQHRSFSRPRRRGGGHIRSAQINDHLKHVSLRHNHHRQQEGSPSTSGIMASSSSSSTSPPPYPHRRNQEQDHHRQQSSASFNHQSQKQPMHPTETSRIINGQVVAPGPIFVPLLSLKESADLVRGYEEAERKNKKMYEARRSPTMHSEIPSSSPPASNNNNTTQPSSGPVTRIENGSRRHYSTSRGSRTGLLFSTMSPRSSPPTKTTANQTRRPPTLSQFFSPSEQSRNNTAELLSNATEMADRATQALSSMTDAMIAHQASPHNTTHHLPPTHPINIRNQEMAMQIEQVRMAAADLSRNGRLLTQTLTDIMQMAESMEGTTTTTMINSSSTTTGADRRHFGLGVGSSGVMGYHTTGKTSTINAVASIGGRHLQQEQPQQQHLPSLLIHDNATIPTTSKVERGDKALLGSSINH